ncbi:MAG: tRNA (guanosine(46)-N7)-methyltransferase TrmB [Chitinophagales bacterium]
MGKDKLKRFEEMASFKNVYQNPSFKDPKMINSEGTIVNLKGQWRKDHFVNENPIVLELACGKGEYAYNLAKRTPNKNFIGIDIKGARLHKGAKDATENNIQNVAYFRTKIELLDLFFEENEVDEIWITFCDPFPKDRHEKHRLTSNRFFDLYRKIAKKDTIIHLKHDNPDFFDYALERLKEEKIKPIVVERDIYNNGTAHAILTEVQTHYEKMHIKDGRKINYLQFKLFGNG